MVGIAERVVDQEVYVESTDAAEALIPSISTCIPKAFTYLRLTG